MKKSTIQVRHPDGTTELIRRKLHVDQVGNFNRIACRYRKQTFLVHSELGDLGDPFRANQSYLDSLYIESDQPCAWNLH